MFGVTLFILPFMVFSIADAVGTTLKVSSILVSPYLQESGSKTDNGTGNAQYEGYIKDLLDAISDNIQRDYEITLSDGYGRENDDKSWTGMIGDVVTKKADIAAGPLIITMPREEVVDFTYPFQKFEAKAVMRKRHWNKKPQINTVKDFLDQNIIKLGIVKDGPMAKELEESSIELHQKIWETLKNHSAFLPSNNDGLERVKWDEDFAFFMESSTADLIVNKKPCEFVGIPGGFYKRSYGLAVANQSPLRDTLNTAIADLFGTGKIQELEKKWLKGDDCSGAVVVTSSFLTMVLMVITVFGCLV